MVWIRLKKIILFRRKEGEPHQITRTEGIFYIAIITTRLGLVLEMADVERRSGPVVAP